MPEYTLSRQSQNDLEEIARYTDKRWGIKKRYAYMAKLEKAFRNLAENPRLGFLCTELKGSPFRHKVARHFIFYRENPMGIEIIRILHDRMDSERHL